jgi:hypothetical protein
MIICDLPEDVTWIVGGTKYTELNRANSFDRPPEGSH